MQPDWQQPGFEPSVSKQCLADGAPKMLQRSVSRHRLLDTVYLSDTLLRVLRVALGEDGLSGSHRSTHIAGDFASRAIACAGQTAAGVRIAGISHCSIIKNIVFASQANIAGFLQKVSLAFPVISNQTNVFSHR